MTATVRGIAADGRGGSIDVDFKREYTVKYLVRTDDRSDGPATVRTAFGIPNVGDLYTPGNDFDPQAIVTNKRVSQGGSPWEWEVDVTYSTDVKEEPEKPASPLDEPPRVSWGFQERRILVPGRYQNPDSPSQTQDFQLGVTNSAGELYDPQPEMDISEPILTISKNVATISPSQFFSIANCVNSDTFYGSNPRQLRLRAPTAESAYDKTIGTYWQVTYGFAYKWDTWDIQVLNQGTFYKLAGWKFPCKDKEGHRFVGLLTSTGGILNSASDEHQGTWYSGGADPSFSRFRVYREINFSSLGIF